MNRGGDSTKKFYKPVNRPNKEDFVFGIQSVLETLRSGKEIDKVIHDWKEEGIANPYKIEKRVDSRGGYELQAGFIVAAGKTFKSGKLNIPVNVYVIPNKDGIRMGASFGFNAKR